jgi:L-fuconolactonase
MTPQTSPIVDSHVHLWDPQRFRMPWLDDLDALRRPFGLETFAEHARGLNVREIVYVQVDTTPAYGFLEARWAARQDPQVAGVVAWAPMDDGRVAATYLESLKELGPRIKGVRRLFQSEPDPDVLVAPDLLRGLRLLPEYDLSFDICIRHQQLPCTLEMVRACPETQFILDHLGKPDVRAGLLDPWREHVAALAELPNVVCKVSGLVTEADHARWTAGDLEPYVAHVLQVFGEDRVLFGGDWPVVTLAAEYGNWVTTLEQLTSNLSATARQKLWADNARRIYRL